MYSVDRSAYFLDKSYEQRALELIGIIKSSEEEEIFQPLTPVSDFFSTTRKIQSLEIKDKLFQTAFLEFSSQSNVRWIALKIAKEETRNPFNKQ